MKDLFNQNGNSKHSVNYAVMLKQPNHGWTLTQSEEVNSGVFTRDDFFQALARASDPWERQMVHDIENGRFDSIIAEIDEELEKGTLEEL